MPRIIKDLKSFNNNEKLNEDFSWGNLISGALDLGGQGLRKTIKEKIAASIMEKFGVRDNSIFSGLVQEVVDAIPVKDYPEIIMGEKANVEYLAPFMVQAIGEFIERKGLDTLADSLGLDPRGWLYSTLVNSFQTDKGKETLKNLFVEAFGGKESKGSVARDAISGLPDRDKAKISDSVKQRISTLYGKNVEMEPAKDTKGIGDYASDFWHSLLGDKESKKTF
jgi:hypothetical protein